MISIELNRKINFYLTSLLAFFTPIHPKILPLFIGLIVINWVINPSNIKRSFKNLTANYALLASVILYLLYIIGMLYTTDLNFGLKVLETKLSLLLLPLVYSAYIITTKEKLQEYLKYFVYGCATYAIICLSYACYAFYKPVYTDLYGVMYDLGSNYFYYSYLSLFFHPSYSAMFCVLSLLIIVVGLKKKLITMNWKIVLLIGLFFIFIFLLSSKAGWISLFLLFVYIFTLLIKLKKVAQILYITFPVLIVFLVLNVYFTPNFSQRLPQIDKIVEAITGKSQNDEATTTGSDTNTARVFIWKASYELFLEHFLVGNGTGDAKEILLEKYKEKQMTTELKYELNSHNQFLTTSIYIGIGGLVVLLFMLLYPLMLSIKQKNYILTGFIVLLIINLMFESMFEKQAGLVFYAFFNTLLCSSFSNE